MDVLTGVGRNLKGVVAGVLIPVMLVVPAMVLAQEQVIGAKVSIDSNGAVEVNNVEVYNPEGELYADSGQIMSDASEGEEGEEDESWYKPTWGKFLLGLATIGVIVGVAFIVDNNVDHDNDDGYWYYDADCDCYRYHD